MKIKQQVDREFVKDVEAITAEIIRVHTEKFKYQSNPLRLQAGG